MEVGNFRFRTDLFFPVHLRKYWSTLRKSTDLSAVISFFFPLIFPDILAIPLHSTPSVPPLLSPFSPFPQGKSP